MVVSVATEDANIGYLRFAEKASPSTPAADFGLAYFKADGLLYTMDDNGTETPATTAGAIILNPASDVRNIIEPAADFIPLIVRGSIAAQTKKILVAQEGSADTEVFSLSGVGAAIFQNFTDSTSGFKILDKDGGISIFNVDTTNERVGIGTDTPSKVLDILGDVTITPATDIVALTVIGHASSTADLFNLKDGNGSTLVFAVEDDGKTYVQPKSDGTTVFRVRKAAGAAVLQVDTQNSRVSIGVGSPSQMLTVGAGGSIFNEFDANNGNMNINSAVISINYDLLLGGDGVLAQQETTTPTADAGYGKTYWKDDNQFYGQDGAGDEHLIHGFPVWKSYTVTTQGLGANPDVYAAGFYDFAVGDPGLDEGNLTQAIGAANLSHAAHAFIVAGGAGATDAGVVGLKVAGISITDGGARNATDEEILSADITTLNANDYLETSKKWLGAPVFTLYTVSGSPVNFSLALNYGLVKYEDFGNSDFTVTNIEAVGLAGAADNDFDIKLLHHKGTGWTYNDGAFTPVIAANTIASLVGDHATDDKLASSDHFAWRRTGLTTAVNGDDSEGIVIFISSTANSAVEYCNLHVGVEF